MPTVDSIVSDRNGYRYYLTKSVNEPSWWEYKHTHFTVGQCQLEKTPKPNPNVKMTDPTNPCLGMQKHVMGSLLAQGSSFNRTDIFNEAQNSQESNRKLQPGYYPMPAHDHFDFFGKFDSPESQFLELIILAHKNEKDPYKKAKLELYFYEALNMAAWGIIKDADAEKVMWVKKLLGH